MTHKALLLDVDGTLYSSVGFVGRVYSELLAGMQEKTGRPARLPEDSEILHQIGRPVSEVLSGLAPDLTRDEVSELRRLTLERLVSEIASGAGEHYPGVRETLEELRRRGYHLYTASNGRRRYVEAVLFAGGYHECFAAVPTLDGEGVENKTELVRRILEKYSHSPRDCCLVGDRDSDREAAAENGCDFAACLYGHGDPSEHRGAKISLGRFCELLDHFP